MAEYPHLKLPFHVEGSAKSTGGGGGKKDERTIANEANRQEHGTSLRNSVAKLSDYWTVVVEERSSAGFELPNKSDIPLFLHIDTEVFPIDTLLNWGIEVVSEENDGYVIGASTDNLVAFGQNVQMFLDNKGIRKNTAAKIWEIESGLDWRIQNILKGDIAKKWHDIADDSNYIVEFGISCNIYNKLDYPNRTDFDSETTYQEKLAEFKEQEKSIQIQRDELQIERESDIEKYAKFYKGEIVDIWDTSTDAVFIKVSINGKGLKDIVLTYQYLFTAELSQQFNVGTEYRDSQFESEVNILAPANGAPRVCVIDSGIQEGHRLLAAGIDSASSRSYIDGDSSVADHVRLSGHGTKVAGAVLYPTSVPTKGEYQLEVFVQNARILDADNRISDQRFAPQLMNTIVDDFETTRIFNLSVAENGCYAGTHMPALAAAIDKIIFERNVLFLIAAGNIDQSNINPDNPGIAEYIQKERNYPEYLNEHTSKVSCPGVSLFAITVGSVGHADFENEDYKAMGGKNYVSPFSRTGLGLWGSIKPDVVEYGGDIAKHKINAGLITHENICPELVNSTLYNAPAVSRDSYGTSFSTPKVSYIAAKLQAEHPHETAQMYRALIIQSARLPAHCFINPTHDDIRRYGYGIPDINRALNNTPGRITFIQNGTLSPKRADIYKLNIPQDLRGENNNNLLVEVTLSFSARVKLTRKGAHQYLSSWLEWKSSKYNEDFNSFRNRTIEYLDLEDTDIENLPIDQTADAIKWCLRENPKWSENRINRNNSTAQKSWAIIQSHQFASDFSIAVIGHKGWDKDIDNEIPYSICVSFEALDGQANIYQLLSEAQIEVTQAEQELLIN